MKISATFPIAFASFFSCASLFSQDVDPNTYYFSGSDKNNVLTSRNAWTLSDGSKLGDDAPLPSENTNLVWDKAGYDMNYMYTAYVKSITVNAAGTTFNLNSNCWVRTVDDFTVNINSDRLSDVASGIIQAGNGTSPNGFDIGGNMVLNSSKNLLLRMRCDINANVEDPSKDRNFSSYSINVGGQLQMNSSGSGVIRVLLSDSHYGRPWTSDNTGQMMITGKPAEVSVELGGLDGKGAISTTKWFTTTATVNFKDNSDGVFAGGSWEGALTKFSAQSYEVLDSDGELTKLAKETLIENSKTAESHISFEMNGSGSQSVTVYKAANAASHGIGGISGETDATIDSVKVNSGEFIMNTELAVGEILLSGGRLGFSSGEKVGKMTIDGGELLFGGAINAGDVTVGADSVKIIFKGEDLSANELTIINYDYIDLPYDANEVFSAYDADGNKLGGSFSLTGGMDGAGSLVYTVPEPAAAAAFLGALALFVAARRRK